MIPQKTGTDASPENPRTLLDCFLDILAPWQTVFPQTRTFLRAVRQAVGGLVCLGRHTLSRIIWTNGGQFKDWRAEYFLFSRCQWEPSALFAPILQRVLAYCPGRYIGVAIDDTRVHKTGLRIQQAFVQRDPLSPKYRVNFMLGVRFLQASLLVPLFRRAKVGARAIPIAFEESSAVKRPRRKSSGRNHQAAKSKRPRQAGKAQPATPPEAKDDAVEKEWKQYRAAQKLHNLSTHFVQLMGRLRTAFDAAGAANQILLLALDNSFCNRTVFRTVIQGVELIARARKNAVLCRRAEDGSRRFYDTRKFTPEQVRFDESMAWQTTRIFYGGKWRKVEYKQVAGIYWQGGGRQRPLRLLVVKPTRYRKKNSARSCYTQPAYLLTTVVDGTVRQLLQIYFDRWQIGVSSQGHIVQSVKDRPRSKDSDPVAGEASWRESKTTEPSDKHTRKECAQSTRLQRAVNADVASLHEFPVAETVDNARKQQGLAETSPKRQPSPAGYQRRHGVKDDVETGETLGARRRNLAEEMPAITVSGKCGHRCQGDGSGRSTGDRRAAKRAWREGPGPVSTPLTKMRQG
jgi:hypothetical protein